MRPKRGISSVRMIVKMWGELPTEKGDIQMTGHQPDTIQVVVPYVDLSTRKRARQQFTHLKNQQYPKLQRQCSSLRLMGFNERFESTEC